MAVNRHHSGLSILELLLALVITAVIAAGVFSGFRALAMLERKEKTRIERDSARAIIKAAFSSAIVGASRYVPVPIARVGSDSLTAAEIVPDVIYQRLRVPGVPRGTYCRVTTGLPKPETDRRAAVAIAAATIGTVHVTTTPSSERCREGRAVRLGFTDFATPLGLSRGGEETEALLPIRDIFTLALDDQGKLRRRSHLTNENQEILGGISAMKIVESAEPRALSISFALAHDPQRTESILLPFLSGGRADWLDYFW